MWDSMIETLSHDDRRELQAQRLRRQVEYVTSRSPFFRDLYVRTGVKADDIRSVDDVRRLPPVLKDDLRASQYNALPLGSHVSATRDEVVWLATTSGTSGDPLVLPKTQRDVEVWTDLCARAFTTAGIGRQDIFQNILAYNWVFSGSILQLGAQKVGAAVIGAGMGNTDKQLWSLTNLGVTALHATPSYLRHLGALLAENGAADSLSLRTVIAGGEIGMAGATAKARLRELFPTVETFADVGGATDIGTMFWAECPQAQGAHLSEDAVLVEVVDPETLEPVADGEIGELIVTDLVSTGAPLLRYRLRDLARLDRTPCRCGRTTARLADGILGRSDDMVTIRAANVFPSTIEEIVRSIDDPVVEDYQLVIDRPGALDRATLRIQFAAECPEAVVARAERTIAERIHLAGGGRFDVVTVPPGTLPNFAYKAMRIIDTRKGVQVEDAFALAEKQSSQS